MAHGSLPSFPQPELHVCTFCLFRPGCCAGHGLSRGLTKPPSSFQTRPFSSSSHTPSHGHLSPLHWRRTVVQPKTRVRYGHSAIIQPSLKNLDLILARFFATKIFDNQHRLPTLTGKATSSLWIICIIRIFF